LCAAFFGIQVRVLLVGDQDVGIVDDFLADVRVEIVCNYDGERPAHSLADSSHHFGISLGIAIHDHGSVLDQNDAVVWRVRCLDLANKLVEFLVEGTLLDVAEETGAGLEDRINVEPELTGCFHNAARYGTRLGGCFKPSLAGNPIRLPHRTGTRIQRIRLCDKSSHRDARLSILAPCSIAHSQTCGKNQ